MFQFESLTSRSSYDLKERMANPSTTSSSNNAVSFFFLRFGGGGLWAFSLIDISSSSPLSSSCFLACIRWARSRRLLRLIRCCFMSGSIVSRHVSRPTRNKLRPVARESASHLGGETENVTNPSIITLAYAYEERANSAQKRTQRETNNYYYGRTTDFATLHEERTPGDEFATNASTTEITGHLRTRLLFCYYLSQRGGSIGSSETRTRRNRIVFDVAVYSDDLEKKTPVERNRRRLWRTKPITDRR